jgi:hypothetical protein
MQVLENTNGSAHANARAQARKQEKTTNWGEIQY